MGASSRSRWKGMVVVFFLVSDHSDAKEVTGSRPSASSLQLHIGNAGRTIKRERCCGFRHHTCLGHVSLSLLSPDCLSHESHADSLSFGANWHVKIHHPEP